MLQFDSCSYMKILCQGRIQDFKRGGGGGGVDGRPYLLRGGRENALTKKIGNNKFYLYLFTPCFLISKYSPDVVQL